MDHGLLFCVLFSAHSVCVCMCVCVCVCDGERRGRCCWLFFVWFVLVWFSCCFFVVVVFCCFLMIRGVGLVVSAQIIAWYTVNTFLMQYGGGGSHLYCLVVAVVLVVFSWQREVLLNGFFFFFMFSLSLSLSDTRLSLSSPFLSLFNDSCPFLSFFNDYYHFVFICFCLNSFRSLH